MGSEQKNRRFWPAVIIITIIALLDFQFFASWAHQSAVSGTVRGAAHIVSLLLIALAGRWAWQRQISYARYWALLYACVIAFVIVAGVLYYQLHVLSYRSVTAIGFIRPFFCSPMPMFLFYVVQMIGRIDTRNVR